MHLSAVALQTGGQTEWIWDHRVLSAVKTQIKVLQLNLQPEDNRNKLVQVQLQQDNVTWFSFLLRFHQVCPSFQVQVSVGKLRHYTLLHCYHQDSMQEEDLLIVTVKSSMRSILHGKECSIAYIHNMPIQPTNEMSGTGK